MSAIFTGTPVTTIPNAPFSGVPNNGNWFRGPFPFNGSWWLMGVEPGNSQMQVLQSADDGATWAIQDSAGQGGNGDGISARPAFDSVNGLIHILFRDGATHNQMYRTFDMNTGLYTAEVDSGQSVIVSGIPLLRANGDILAIFGATAGGSNFSVISGGAWGAITPVFATGGVRTAVVDPLTGIAHVWCGSGVAPKYVTISALNVVSAASAIPFSFATAFGSGEPQVWNDQLVSPFSDSAGAGDCKVLIGTPISAPVWSILNLRGSIPANQQLVNCTSAVFSSGVLHFYFCDQFTFQGAPGPIVSIYRSTYDGISVTGPDLWWDLIANPPAGFGATDPNEQFIEAITVGIDSGSVRLAADAIVDPALDDSQVFASLSITSVSCSITIRPKTYFQGNAQQLVCDVRYPWSIPPEQRSPWTQENSITAPAVGVLTEIWSYLIPDNFYLMLDRLRQFYAPTPIAEGTGAILWIYDVDTPIGAPLATQRPIAQFTTTLGAPDRKPIPVGPIQIRGGSTIRAKVLITDPAVPVGVPNIVSALAEGWLYPVTRSGN